MPRLKPLGNLPDPTAISKLIERYVKVERKYSIEEVSSRARVSQSSYYRRLREPDDITLKELRSFGKALDIPQEELSAALAVALRY